MTGDPTTHRGYRDNNPFDLEDVGIPWDGIVGRDGPYLKFATPLLGLRAGFKDLAGAQRLHGRSTVTAIVTPFAPAADHNDTAAYIAAVAKHLGVAADTPLVMTDPRTLRLFGEACIIEEIGGLPYSDAQLAEGVRLALL